MRFSLLVFLSLWVLPASAQSMSGQPDILTAITELEPLEMDEVLWLARCLYSESDRAEEQRLVAWVVRNRVETKFRGDSYRDVVLEPRQFSAFNTPSERRTYILGLDQLSTPPSWKRTLKIALDVYRAPTSKRPFKVTTRHFYSPISMTTADAPYWADDAAALDSNSLDVDPERFRFFDGIDDFAPEIAPERMTARERLDAAATRRPAFKTRARSFSGKVRRPTRPAARSGNQ